MYSSGVQRALEILLQMEENMYRAFQHFDTDNSGTISQAELREALQVRHHCHLDDSYARIP